MTGAEADARTRRYYYSYLPHHLAELREREKLDALLLDPGWLQAKLEATASPQALVSDYQLYGVGDAQNLIGRTLRLTSGILARDARQLPAQVIGRLAGFEVLGEASGFIGSCASAPFQVRPSCPSGSTLTPLPGAEIARLEATPISSPAFAFSLTGGSHRALMTTQSGCGTS